ncbi:MAG: GntR family transcriptional regulator [Marinilabiliaceae bacterium]|nr:GntR family transcriptional regulator [Marinilabiliaceae bacterium]
MAEIGKYNTLKIVKEVDFGVYLDGGTHGEILMPAKYVPAGCQPGDEVTVFVYTDSEDRPICTTETPLATVGEFALLRVKSVTSIGAFLNWGLLKDLFVPFNEQKAKMREGGKYLVYVYLDDESGRVVASAKIEKFLDNVIPTYEINQEVSLMVIGETDLGYTAIVNNLHTGLLYASEVFEYLEPGQRITGYVKKVREDEKIDLILHKPGYEKIDKISSDILDVIRKNGGFIPVNDKSDAEMIYDTFGISKKSFKKAIGALYKQRLIVIEAEGVRLV